MAKVKSKKQRYWTAFYTKPRHEKRAADRLTKMGFEIFMPMTENMKQWSDRKKKVSEPLFKSYLFAKVDEKERLGILEDSSIVRSVFWQKKPVVIRETEIAAIKEFLGEFPSLSVQNCTFVKHEAVKVNEGVLTGKTGLIREKRGRKYLIEIEQLGMEIVAEVHENLITPSNT